MIIADTNVVSELMRDHPDPGVLEWARKLSAGEVTITVVTIEEIERGLGRLPTGRRRAELEERWRWVIDQFADQVAVHDLPAARLTAAILVRAESEGITVGLADAQIAGICLARTCQLATRNVRDFAGIPGLEVINPFGA